ncbi:MAG: hypothetical protein EA350_00295 [Gemmatimonadales bacterium]|nr:MAG: hypothetical protein EA350_00295 [Gemmatimonadales bacterium]
MNTPAVSPDAHQTLPAQSPSLWRTGLRVGIISSVINSVIYIGAALAGVFPTIIKLDPTEPGMTVFAVILVSMVASFAAMGVWKLVTRWAERPFPVYAWLAGILLLLSFAAPYAVPGTTSAQAWVQNLLHVVVAAAVLWELRMFRVRGARAAS